MNVCVAFKMNVMKKDETGNKILNDIVKNRKTWIRKWTAFIRYANWINFVFVILQLPFRWFLRAAAYIQKWITDIFYSVRWPNLVFFFFWLFRISEWKRVMRFYFTCSKQLVLVSVSLNVKRKFFATKNYWKLLKMDEKKWVLENVNTVEKWQEEHKCR